MSKILRGIGVVITVGGLIMNNAVVKEIYLGGRAKLLLATIGQNAGTRYATCDESTLLKRLYAEDQFQPNGASDLTYNFYNIDNPEEYLKGEDAILVETGPYVIKKHAVKYAVEFKASGLTRDSTNNKASIEYNEANLYIPMDINVDVKKTNMTRGSDLKLNWSNGERQNVASYEKKMPAHLSMTDRITNISPIYQSVIGEANDEFSLILSMVCTPSQINNIFAADTKPQCTNTELNDMEKADCSCCMLKEMYDGMQVSINATVCETFLDESSQIISDLSLLAYYDGGVQVKQAGEKKYSGTGEDFGETLYNQTAIYSPIIQSHTVNDMLFGYPSAYVGKIVPRIYLAQAIKIMKDNGINSRTQAAKELLTGNMDDLLPFKLGDISLYTKKVGSVCLNTCSGAADATASPVDLICDGFAPERYESNRIDDILLGGIDCKPYSTTYATMKMCKDIDSFLEINPSDDRNERCVCADGSDDYKTSGCCLAAGKYDGKDLTSSGCLYPVDGILGRNYAGRYTATGAKPTVDLGESTEALVSRESEKQSTAKITQFICPSKTGPGDDTLFLPELKAFGHYESYEGSDKHNTYQYTGNPRMRQTDHALDDAKPFSSKVSGTSAQYFRPTGLTGYFNEISLTYGHTNKGVVPVYIRDIKSPMNFTEDWGVRPIICDPYNKNNHCHELARLRPAKDALLDNFPAGTGLPFTGLQAIGAMQGPTMKGRPTYFHNPYFMNGDKELFSQHNNSHVDFRDGNGLKLYRLVNSLEDPGLFSVGSLNYELLTNETTPFEMKDEFLDQNPYESYIDLEPATGLGVRVRFRHGISHSFWECDPVSNEQCKLSKFRSSNDGCYSSSNQGSYPCSAANVFSPVVVGGKIIPTYWVDDKQQKASALDIATLSVITDKYREVQHGYGFMVNIAILLTWTLGLPLALQLACFAPEKQFLKQGPLDGSDGSNRKDTSYVASAAES
mmetsp:Transcript_10984/g.20517  ORF Transcript_10984/g.20517 Transcript_10984/m.20517 type:complete len:963 (+) Transcript_10984:178-3066(+)|eukprot:CAMPEP_0176503394 /NCGR_PEP_ID=MMETSP0200_2-20121128/15339_1 /TAXON_ID=947934 /ORGANISM="Chaetoceros sp., Strain GSL56" /LENGTH=962 /DNA_ID=CAMNT_0017902681 /DNA_START=1853 /DNA_END=4741 /DNA_ORIENTATION=-